MKLSAITAREDCSENSSLMITKVTRSITSMAAPVAIECSLA